MRPQYLEILKALSDGTRQDILDFLIKVEECSVNDICRAFEQLAQPTISHHLQVLKRCELVDSNRRGKMIFYSVRRQRLSRMMTEFIIRFNLEIEN